MRASLLLATASLFASLVAPAAVNAQWSYLGLGSRQVHKLRVARPYLFAATDGGLFRRTLPSPDTVPPADTVWEAIGFQGRDVRALLACAPDTLLAGLSQPVSPGDTVYLYRTTDGGTSWHPFQNGFGSGTFSGQVRELDRRSDQPETLFGLGSQLERSIDGGESWKPVGGCVQTAQNVMRVNPYFPSRIWSGGENAFFWPVICWSTDGGDSWQTKLLFAGGDNAVDAITFHPANPNAVYIGMEGQVQRTLDGGESWQSMPSPNGSLYLYGIAISPQNPVRVYCAGAGHVPDPRGVVLYVSDDASSSWSATAYPAPLQYGIFDLLVVANAGLDEAYVAADRGAFRYLTTSGDPTDASARALASTFPLRAVLPNPAGETAWVEFVLPSEREISLQVHSISGKKVSTLAAGRYPAGVHRLSWSTQALPSGIYVVRLQAGEFASSKTLIVLH